MLHTLDDSPITITKGIDIDPDTGYPFVQGATHTTGYIIGIVSAVFYLVSRIPQIVKNVRKSFGFSSRSLLIIWTEVIVRHGYTIGRATGQ